MTDTTAATNASTIIYTFTDEAPALATYSFLPIIEAFAGVAGVGVTTRDISLAGRIIATFPERLTDEQRLDDALAELGELALTPAANIIKLPNISASVPQMKAAIAELRAKGYDLPDYPDEPSTPEELEVRARYGTVMGSAVNPVLRQGNSDRRAPKAVKDYAKSHPHSMGAWSSDSKTHVATMGERDFRANEQSLTVAADGAVRIEHVADDGAVTVLKESVPVLAGEVIDSTAMDVAALRSFLAEQIRDAKEQGVLFSIHLKATMMKVSDPIIFGHAVEVFFADVFAKHGEAIAAAGGDPRNGWASVLDAVESLPADQRAAIEADITTAYENGPDVAMVDSDKGITNLHVPSDVIVDASMPAMIRTSGQMWNAAGDQQDAKAVIPDSSYASVYQVVIEDCIANGAFDPATMGSVPNVGLMAQKAEEYGSHDKTFEAPAAGTIRVVDAASGDALMEQPVGPRDIFRMCQVKDEPIRDWVRLAVDRARATGAPAVFWLDSNRAHDAQLIAKVNQYLGDNDLSGVEIEILSPAAATQFSVERVLAKVSTRSRSPATCCATTSPTCSRFSSWAPARRCSRSCHCSTAVGCSRPALAGRRPSTSNSWSRRTTCDGTRSVSSWHSRCRSSTSPTSPATRGPRSSPTRSTRRPGSCSRTASPRRGDSARSTTGAATSTSRSTGRRRSPRRPTTPIWPPSSRRSRPNCRPTRTPSSPNSWGSRASRRTSAATTRRTPPRPPP